MYLDQDARCLCAERQIDLGCRDVLGLDASADLMSPGRMRQASKEREILDLIGLFYECAIAPELWRSALERLGDLIGRVSIISSVIECGAPPPSEPKFLVSARSDLAYEREIVEHYDSPETNPFVAAMPRLQAGVPVHRELGRELIIRWSGLPRSALQTQAAARRAKRRCRV